MVDRLLASPRYGERWGRHWLDVARYGDTHGYDKDKPRPNAWPYRDYVIRAFNDDKPYGRFVREQVAGDVLYPGTRDGVEALGFIAAGPWDFIGHAEVPETKVDGQIARLLDRDDMVSNTLNAFASLTVQCARCHDHKFDPVSQEDYYSLQAVFAALDRADRPYDADPDVARSRAELAARRAALAARSTGSRPRRGRSASRWPPSIAGSRNSRPSAQGRRSPGLRLSQRSRPRPRPPMGPGRPGPAGRDRPGRAPRLRRRLQRDRPRLRLPGAVPGRGVGRPRFPDGPSPTAAEDFPNPGWRPVGIRFRRRPATSG